MIQVLLTDAEPADVEALLRPVSSELEAITPLSRRMELAAGPEVRERLRAMAPIPVGGAVVTPGGDLAAKFMIHVVLQSAQEPTTEFGVQLALLNGLRRAAEWEIETVATTPLGTGAGNLDAETSATLMVPIILRHQRSGELPRKVTVLVANEYEEMAFAQEIRRAVPHISREGP